MAQDGASNNSKVISQATGWLLELELLNNEHMKNALVLNIYKISPHIREVELLIDTNNRKMLILLKLTGFGRLFKKRLLSSAALDMMMQALPSYTFRVIFDTNLFNKAVEGFKRANQPRLKTQESSSPLAPLSESAPVNSSENLEVETSTKEQG